MPPLVAGLVARMEAMLEALAAARVLSRARAGADAELDRLLRELEERSRARVADLVAPGQVILRLARSGFGVLLDGA